MLLDGLSGRFAENYPLKQLNTWKVGGPAAWAYWPQTAEDLAEAWRRGKEAGFPLRIIGRGSNLLFPDAGLPGLTIVTTMLNDIRWGDYSVWVEAGYGLAKLAQETGEKGWKGLAFARGIPGTVGGALIMNAGAHGGEIGNQVRTVRVLDGEGNFRTLKKEDIRFGYRKSSLPREGWIVEVELSFTPGDREGILVQMAENLVARKKGQPLDRPTAGSTFRNPPHDSAGRLIEAAGWKGKKIGGAQVSEKHANFIVNTGDAKAEEILALIGNIRADVERKYGVKLETEICYMTR